MIAKDVTTSKARSRARPRVCLVEDDLNSALSTSAVLSDAGYDIECHSDGHRALQRLREEPADLILLDLKMPAMDGWEFRVAQRADDTIADIPVIIMTGDASAKAGAIHASSSLMKPFGVGELLSTVERVLVEHEHRKLIESVEQTGRLAMFGAIASSVGHEVNNPLSSAFATLQLIERAMPSCRSDLGELQSLQEPERTAKERATLERLDQRFAMIDQQVSDGQRALKRVQMVVRNLQNLCLRADEVRERLDVHHVIDQAIAMIVHELDSRALLTRSLGQVEEIWGNESKLIQVTAHLLTKAAQTILPGQVRDNSIHVATRQERGHVVIEIADSGNELSAESLTRVFEPAAACAGDGNRPGLGLGLPLCRDIIEAHDGQLEVHTQRGCGSRFVVRLPCIDLELSTVASEAAPRQVDLRTPAGAAARPKVWIVDDEAVLAVAFGRLLGSAYEVTVTKGPHDVLLRLATGEEFDVLLCDVMMPEMTGVGLAERIEERWPRLAQRIVFMSGGALTPSLSAFVTSGSRLFLAKPFLSEELNEIVALAARGP